MCTFRPRADARTDAERSYFVAYELIKKELTPKGQDPAALSLGAVVVAGGFAGVTMWTFAIPPDVRPLPKLPLLAPPSSAKPHSSNRSSSPDSKALPKAPTRASSTAPSRPSRRTVPRRSSRASHRPWRARSRRTPLASYVATFSFSEGWELMRSVQLGVELSLQAMNKVF